MELCHNCPVPASCAIRGKCITDLAPVPDPRLSITADEFAAMARDAERWRKFCSLDADVYVNTTGWSFVGKGFGEMLARHLDLMAERNKEKS